MSTNQKSALVMLDGGAHAGAVQPGAIFWQQQNLAGKAPAALFSAAQQVDLRRLMLQDFLNKGDLLRSILPPLQSPKRLLLGGLADQVPVMKRLVRKYGHEPQDNLAIVALDLESKSLYVFEGDYDLAVALAASCAPWPAARPVEYRDRFGKLHYLVDAAAYLLHKERIYPDHPAIIMRMFNVGRRQPEADEHAVHIAYPRTKIVRRLTPREYDKYWQHGYDAMERGLRPAIDSGELSDVSVWKYAGISIGSLIATTLCNAKIRDCATV